jgi:hypothetical protein
VSFYLKLSLGAILLVSSIVVFVAPAPIAFPGLTWQTAPIVKLSSASVMIALSVILFITAARSYPRELVRQRFL